MTQRETFEVEAVKLGVGGLRESRAQTIAEGETRELGELERLAQTLLRSHPAQHLKVAVLVGTRLGIHGKSIAPA